MERVNVPNVLPVHIRLQVARSVTHVRKGRMLLTDPLYAHRVSRVHTLRLLEAVNVEVVQKEPTVTEKA